jgi:hypothetical protein
MGGFPSSLECYGEPQRVSSEKLGAILGQTVHKLCKCSENRRKTKAAKAYALAAFKPC